MKKADIVNSMFTLDDIDVYIMNWKKVNENSLQLYNAIRPIVSHTTIINCDEHWSLDPSIQHIQLDDSCYYGSQFNTAIKHTRANALLCILVGDNQCEHDFSTIFRSVLRAFNTHKIGVYAPHDKRSTVQKVLRKYRGSLYHVKNTDCGFWCIHPNIHGTMKRLDYTISKYGWGIDVSMCKEAKRRGMLVVRDNSIEIDQLDHTCGYDRAAAAKDYYNMLHAYNSIPRRPVSSFSILFGT
jgi:hypothetical protein